MITLNSVTKIYKSKGGRTTALKDVSIKFAETGLNFILGKSGCGKSTLLNLIGGLDRPTGGEIVIDGENSTEFSESEMDAFRNTSVGFVFQEYNLMENHTVGFNINLALELNGEKADRQRVDEMLRQLRLVDADGNTFYDRYVNELSGGQKQRVAIARALVKNPKIILADEPTGALDSETGRDLYRLLKQIAADRLVIVVTHDRKGAEEFGDRIIELSDGQIVSDTSEEVSAEKSSREKREYRKSRLPLNRILLLGVEGVKSGPIRFLLSIVLTAVTLVIFGFSYSAVQSDETSTFVRTMYDHHYSVVGLTKRGGFSTTEYNKIVDFNGGIEPPRAFSYAKIIQNKNLGMSDETIHKMNNPYISLGLRAIFYDSTYAEVNPQTGEKDLNLTADARFKDKSLCRMPDDYNEIAITDLLFDVYHRCGYLSDDGKFSEIKTPDDMIGKTISGFKVCGIYSTEIDGDFLKAYDQDNYGMTEREIALGKSYELEEPAHSYFVSDSIISYTFFKEGFTKANKENVSDIGGFYIVKLSGDFNKDYKLLSALYDKNGNTMFIPESFVTVLVSSPTLWSNPDTLRYTTTAIIILAVFSVLMILNSLLTSIDHRKRELGVLRALGAGAKDLIKICLAESMISAGLSFILGTVGAIVLCHLANAYYYVSIFSCGFVAMLLMFLLSVGFTAITTLLAAINISRKKTIDILSGN